MNRKPSVPAVSRIGQVFQNLTVLAVKREGGSTFFKCRCTCGGEDWYRGGNVTSGGSKRCKKCSRKTARQFTLKHGKSGTLLYTWYISSRDRLVPSWAADFNELVKATKCPDTHHLGPINPRDLIGPGNFKILEQGERPKKLCGKHSVFLDGKQVGLSDVAEKFGVSRARVHKLLQEKRLYSWIAGKQLAEKENQ
jgi:hypothetical protein